MKKTISSLVALTCMIFVLSSCTKEEVQAGNSNDGKGSIRTLLTDDPFPFNSCTEANVGISKVEIKTENGEFVVLYQGNNSYNMMNLTNGTTAEIQTSSIDVGTYTHARITTTSASVAFDNNSSFEAANSNNTFTVSIEPAIIIEDAENSALLCDLDLGQSFSFFGMGGMPLSNWIPVNFITSCDFHPHFRVCDFNQTGVISGNVTVAGTPFGNANCYININGETVSTHTAADGTFTIIGVEAGTYTVYVETESGDSGEASGIVVSGTDTANCEINL